MPTERRLNQHIFISSNNGVPCSDEKINYTSYKSPQGSQGILLQDKSKSLKIHIISVYLCQVQNMQREAAYRLGIQMQEVPPWRCTRDAREPTSWVVGAPGEGQWDEVRENPNGGFQVHDKFHSPVWKLGASKVHYFYNWLWQPWFCIVSVFNKNNAVISVG